MTTSTEYALSREAGLIQRSEMRELLKHAVDPAIISLATGLPASDHMPWEAIRDCYTHVINNGHGNALQYGPPNADLREWIARYMGQRGVKDVTPEQVFITNGNQQALQIMSRLLLDPEDTAVIEEVTFTGIKVVTSGRGLHTIAVPTDLETGVDVDALERAFQSEPRPKLAILISDFSNPLGVTISRDKRERIAALASQYGVVIVEDDPYSLLRFEGTMQPPIKAFDKTGHVFYLGSFSKMLAPAMRLGWMIIPEGLYPRITALREAIDLESSRLSQAVVAEFLKRDLLADHLDRLNSAHRDRSAALMAALDRHLGDVATWTTPQGGLFVWVTLPSKINGAELVKQAIENKVVFIPGGAFASVPGHSNSIRLNFSNVTLDNIHEGVRRLAEVVNRQL